MSCTGRFSLIGLAAGGSHFTQLAGPWQVCVCQVLVNGGYLILKAEKRFAFQVPVVNPLCKMESSFVNLHPHCNLAVSLVLEPSAENPSGMLPPPRQAKNSSNAAGSGLGWTEGNRGSRVSAGPQ